MSEKEKRTYRVNVMGLTEKQFEKLEKLAEKENLTVHEMAAKILKNYLNHARVRVDNEAGSGETSQETEG